jgi:hypothetical protein
VKARATEEAGRWSNSRTGLRVGAAAGLAGLILQAISSQLHPGHVQPNDSVGAFLEYAAFDAWTLVHIGQFFGTLLLGVGLVLLALSIPRHGLGGAMAVAAAVTTLVLVGVFSVQMALDGVALRFAIDAWIAAPPELKPQAFAIADTLRSLEKGLSAFFHLLNGTTLTALGLAILLGHGYPRWLSIPALMAGIAFLGGGVSTAQTGFSDEAGQFLGPALPVTLVFLLGAFVAMWLRGRPVNGAAPADEGLLAVHS